MMKIKMLLLAALFTAPAMAVDFSEASKHCMTTTKFVSAALAARNGGVGIEALGETLRAKASAPVEVTEAYIGLAQTVYSLPTPTTHAGQRKQIERTGKEVYMGCMHSYGY